MPPVDAPTTTALATGTASDRFLMCSLGGETYALDIRRVSEIIEFRSLTEVPMMPAFVRGVLNLRGRVLPVVDLQARFGRGATGVGRRTTVVVVEPAPADATEGAAAFGVMVDAVTEVAQLDADDIEPAPSFGTGLRPEFLQGMARHHDAFVVVLDLGSLLAGAELQAS